MVKHAKEPLYTRNGIKVYAYDTVDYLDSDEAIAGFLSLSLTEEYDPDIFLGAIGVALRAKGLNTTESLLKIAEEMRPPDHAPTAIRTAGKPAAKRSVKKTSGKKPAARNVSSHPKSRRKREAAVA